MNKKTENNLRVASVGVTLLFTAILIVMGLTIRQGDHQTIRYVIAAIAMLSCGLWLYLREKRDRLAAGKPFSGVRAVTKIMLSSIVVVALTLILFRFVL